LIGEPGLDHHARTVAIGGLDDPVLDLLEQPYRVEHLDNACPSIEAVEADQLLRNEPVLSLRDPCAGIEHVEHVRGLDTGAAADLEVVEIVSRRDLDGARAELGIGMLVGDDRDQPARQRVPDLLAHPLAVAIVLRMHRDGHVGKHRLRPRGGDMDEAAAVLERIFEVPELALDLLGLDLEVRDGGAELRIPIDEALVAVEQALAIELHEHLEDGAAEALVHREALVRPVARSAEAAELAGDLASAFGLPFPDEIDEPIAGHVGALAPLSFELALDDHLGCNSGMIHADHPKRILPLQARVADEDVLERVVERVADMERAGHVRRRDDDREGLGVGALRAEQPPLLPIRIPAGLDRGRVESLRQFAHAGALNGTSSVMPAKAGISGREAAAGPAETPASLG
jgi:hypothetical protein